MPKSHKPLLVIGLMLGFSAQSHASTVYNLSNDFSYSNNPNGPWSFLEGGTLLTAQVPLNNGNPAYPATLPSYWGTGNNLSVNTPDVIKAAVDGSAAGETNADFLTGDVLVHSANNGVATFIEWTAPSDGTIDFNSAIWYAHSVVTRSNDFSIFVNGVAVDAGIVNDASFPNRSTPSTFADPGLDVTAGEIVAIAVFKSPGQDVGSLDGISETINFTPTATAPVGSPEPASLALLGAGLAGLGAMRRRKKA